MDSYRQGYISKLYKVNQLVIHVFFFVTKNVMFPNYFKINYRLYIHIYLLHHIKLVTSRQYMFLRRIVILNIDIIIK